jgi:CubicO group peptidase (beta-lactamase class C family)
MNLKQYSAGALFLLLFAGAKAQQAYFPPAGQWDEKAPSSLGLDAGKLESAISFAKEKESQADKNLKLAHYQSSFGREPFGYPVGPMKDRGEANGLIIYKGYIVGKWGDPSRVDLTFSVAKSFLTATAGLAVERQLIKSEKDLVHPYMGPIIPYEPNKANFNKADHLQEQDVFELFDTPHNKKITWEHLLRQTSDWEGTLWGKPDWADRPQGSSSDWLTRERNTPGTVYKYNDTRVNVLALALLNVWRKPLPQVLKEHLMDPIGASPTWRWTGYENSYIVLDGMIIQSVSGGSHWGGGLMINAYDQARFGYLTMKNGNWAGKQVLSAAWIAKAKTPTDVQSNYGFMNFFLNTGKKEIPAAPESAFFHLGAGTNMVYVDPENDLLVVTRWINNEDKAELIARIIESLPKK